MYRGHDSFNTPDSNKKIWRYMDFLSFFVLLQKKALWFSVPSSLGDPWEGMYTLPHTNPEEIRGLVERTPGIDKDSVPKTTSLLIGMAKNQKHLRDFMAVNCWYMSEYESDALWRLFSGTAGIAIQSDIGSLIKSLENTPREVYVGSIKYVDHKTTALPLGNLFNSVLWKRKAFEHENEIRAVMLSDNIKRKSEGEKRQLSTGSYVDVDLDQLIVKICVSPLATDWFVEAVKSLAEKYNVNKEVVYSELSDKPHL